MNKTPDSTTAAGLHSRSKQRRGPAAAMPGTAQLLTDLSHLIDSTRQRVTRTVNAELVLMYWKIGARIRQDILGGERAVYSELIVSTLSRQLTASYGKGFGGAAQVTPSRSRLSPAETTARYASG